MNERDEVKRIDGTEYLETHVGKHRNSDAPPEMRVNYNVGDMLDIPTGGYHHGETVIISTAGHGHSSLLAHLMGKLDRARALIISPADEETALQLLESLRAAGVDADIINNHAGLQALKEAWGGSDFEGSGGAWRQKTAERIMLGGGLAVIDSLLEDDRWNVPEACLDLAMEETEIKQGYRVPKHHMHLSQHGIPKRGRQR